MKLLLMADRRVGLAITRWLLEQFRDDVALVVATADNEISAVAREAGVSSTIHRSGAETAAIAAGVKPDLGVLAWWPKLVKQPLLGIPRLGFINTHPSLLPHNRGKHYNFWALVEQAPFGVSLHMVEEGIDSGDVVAQRGLSYGWEDTGETLYSRAGEAMVQLFRETYPALRSGDIPRRKQDLTIGSFHRAAEMDAASRLDLDASYNARELLNRLRARTFSGHPSCWFNDDGETFEVRVEIKRKRP